MNERERDLEEMQRDLNDGIRCESEITGEELDALAALMVPQDMGTIDPNTSAVFLCAVKFEHGRSDFLEVLPDGTVQVRRCYGELEPTEANAIRRYIADHNAWWERNRVEAHQLCEEWKRQQAARKSA